MSSLPHIPRYRLLEEVGHGAMSVVYRATDSHLAREVAVKVLHRHLAGRPEERQRFRREAHAIARIRHPNILEVHDYSGEDSEEAWLVTEYVRGPTLRAFADTTGLGLPEVGALIAVELGEALAQAHQAGIIHRDVKPENVMIRADGTVVLTDFGVARLVDLDDRMTMTGALMGSPAHMAPEVVEGRGADARSDVFSLGTVLYWAICGRLPFTGASTAEVLRRVSEGRFEDPRAIDPRVSDALADIVTRALARDPAARQAHAGQLTAELRGYLTRLGLEDANVELKAFFTDPAGVKRALRQRLVDAWIADARKALERRDAAGAIQACDQVLALSPGHAEAEALLASVRRRRLRMRLGVGALGATLVGVLLALGASWVANTPRPHAEADPAPADPGRGSVGPDSPTPPPEVPAAPPPDPQGAPAPAAATLPRGPSPRGETSAPAPAPRRTLRVMVTPFARIYVDGRLVATDIEGRATLPLGPHAVRLEREGFVPVEERVDLEAGEAPYELRRRLQPRPAVLRILNDQGAAVSVDGELRGTVSGGRLDIPVTFPDRPGGGSRFPLEVLVRLEKPGHAPDEQTVTLTPGATVEVQQTLEPEP